MDSSSLVVDQSFEQIKREFQKILSPMKVLYAAHLCDVRAATFYISNFRQRLAKIFKEIIQNDFPTVRISTFQFVDCDNGICNNRNANQNETSLNQSISKCIEIIRKLLSEFKVIHDSGLFDEIGSNRIVENYYQRVVNILDDLVLKNFPDERVKRELDIIDICSDDEDVKIEPTNNQPAMSDEINDNLLDPDNNSGVVNMLPGVSNLNAVSVLVVVSNNQTDEANSESNIHRSDEILNEEPVNDEPATHERPNEISGGASVESCSGDQSNSSTAEDFLGFEPDLIAIPINRRNSTDQPRNLNGGSMTDRCSVLINDDKTRPKAKKPKIGIERRTKNKTTKRETRSLLSLNCEVCKKRFSSQAHLACHRQYHLAKFPFHCRICLRGFHSKENRISHEEQCKMNRFECFFCGQSLRCVTELNHHIRLHTGEKPFRCLKCTKTFSWKYSLERHQKSKTACKSNSR